MPRVLANGINQNFEIYGNGSPLVFIHGLGLDLGMWDLQIGYFRKFFKVLVYDLRGHGMTDCPKEDYSIELFSKDLYELLNALKIYNTTICGLSLGGRIAIQFCLDYSKKVKALILADTQSEVSKETQERFENLARIAGKDGMDQVTSILYSTPLFEGLAKMNPERHQQEKRKTALMSSTGFANSARAIAHMKPLTSKLAKITVPTLVVVGEEDKPYVEFSEVFTKRISNCKREIIPHAGHISNLEQPNLFTEIFYSFLEEINYK